MTPRADGADILVQSVVATCFGGAFDQLDNGETASGVLTKGNIRILGCALPMQGFHATRTSPLPKMPWHTKVIVVNPRTNATVTVELIDLGPSPGLSSGACIDLTPMAMLEVLGLPYSDQLYKKIANTGECTVNFRIVGMASRLPANTSA